MVNGWLVVTGTWLDYDFPYWEYGGNFIIPTVTHSIIFQRGTTNQYKTSFEHEQN